MKILVSGFEKFDGLEENPSQILVESLHGVESIILPVTFKECFQKLKEKIEQCQPDIVICTGLAGIRDEITPERIAINLIEARIPDNEGNQPIGEKISANGPDGLFATIPIKKMAEVAARTGVKASVSNTAGTYVCNFLMYKVLEFTKDKNIKSGFIHIPPLDKISLEKTKVAFQEMLKVVSLYDDTEFNTGTEC